MTATTSGPVPSACRYCGIPERRHYQQWTEFVGWHQWERPTDAQILRRMKARRAARPADTTRSTR